MNALTVITLALILALAALAGPIGLAFEQTIPATYSRTTTWR